MQGEPAVSADWVVVLQILTDDGFTVESCFEQPSRCSLNAHTTLPCTGRASLTICAASYFIEENKINTFVYPISQSANADSSLYQREPCNSFGLK